MKRLTKTLIEKTVPPASGKGVWLRDTELRGFAARVMPSGFVGFYLAVKTNGTSSKVAIGDKALMSVEDAREKARVVKRAIAEGRPWQAAVGSEKAPSKTVADLAAKFQAVHSVKESTKDLYACYWRAHIVKNLGTKPIATLTHLDVHEWRVATKSKWSANRAIKLLAQAIDAMNTWGGEWPTLDKNPARGVKKHKEEIRQRPLSREEARRLYDELDRRVTADPENRTAWLLIVLMLTGLRTGEWRNVPYSWVDFHTGTLELPTTKGNVSRTVMLDELVLDVLKQMPRRGDWLFPNARGNKPIGKPKRQWKTIKKTAGVRPEFRVHDLRHSFASTALIEGKLSIKEVGELLGHAPGSATTLRYLRLVDDQERQASKRATAAVMSFARR